MIERGGEVTKTPVGRFLTWDHDFVFATIRRTGYWDKHLLPVFEQNTDKSSVVIDVGAHCGFFSVFFAKRVRKVYAVEPQPYIFSILERNIALNNCKNIQALNVAAYDRETTLSIAPEKDQTVANLPMKGGKIDYSKTNNSAGIALSPKPGEIPASKLDDLIPKDEIVSFIKCDAQGADLRALKGATNIIRKCRPIIIFEFEQGLAKIYCETWQDYEAFFDRIKYSLTPITNPSNPVGRKAYQDYMCKPFGPSLRKVFLLSMLIRQKTRKSRAIL